MPLFEQSGREIRLTAAGEEVLRTARELDDVWTRLEGAWMP
jgi:DNA-binding transcriptional LysR family regulator